MKKFFANPAYRTIFLIWLAWALIMLAFQTIVPMRLSLQRPDFARPWTAGETSAGSQLGKTYLNEPFLNRHVSWDSEYYLAIAVEGYEAADINRLNVSFGNVEGGAGFWPFVIPPNVGYGGLSLSYAFFPLYPLVMRAVAVPLSVLGLTPIATATLAGVLVSMLGTLAAMFALYEFGREEPLGGETPPLRKPNPGGETAPSESDSRSQNGLRAAFYLIIFPSAFFLAQVYTEGLFIGLAFSSLLLMRRGQRGWAALLAVLATFTRAAGVALAIPLLIDWIKTGEWRELDLEWRQIYFKGVDWKVVGRALIVLSPIIAFQLWRMSYYGLAFSKVEDEFFGRGILNLGSGFIDWLAGLRDIFSGHPHASAYYLIEWGAVILGFVACILGFKRHPDLALFGFLVVFLSFTSGPAQGMHRYILAAPPVFLFLSRLGRNKPFDYSWTVLSVLLMGMMATLFSFDFWTG